MRRFLFPVFAVGVALLYYGRFLDNFFTFDDFKYLENMCRGWSEVAIGYGSLRLVSNLAWWPLFRLSGFDPLGYNLFALFFFTVNAILLYYLLVKLLPDRITAFIAAAFFATGSAGADAVFWKATNSSLISLFFYLSTLICYVRYRQAGDRSRYLLALALYFVAMFSKEEAASLPLIAALIEIIFFSGWTEKRALLNRLAPFCAVIVFYLLANAFVFNYLLGGKAEPEKLFHFRPLYSLLGGGTAFFLSPDGFLKENSPPVYLTVLFIALSLLIKPARKLLLFGYLWVFLAFLPESLTILGQLQPRVIVNSVSRYLYITSIGASIVFAAVLAGLREWIPLRIWYAVTGGMLLLFIWHNSSQVWARGEEWRHQGADVKDFIVEVKREMPVFPNPSYVHVVNGPTGRAFIQQALRAFYSNPGIYWVNDPEEVTAANNWPLYLILYRVSPEMPVHISRLR